MPRKSGFGQGMPVARVRYPLESQDLKAPGARFLARARLAMYQPKKPPRKMSVLSDHKSRGFQ
jgi:hypothetical protein